ncbi:MAG: SH3 domain-containing protein [Phycisphaerae bacterium]
MIWLCVLPAAALGGPADQPRPVIATGEVIGEDVYIRSGPSMNHYAVCKLGAGDRVAILGERGAWYEISPPKGVFSLISGEYVDTGDNKTGVVNGDNVRVRAGSLLNSSKYTVQTMLSRGADVSIIGVEPDGFLRIVPPSEATLWISRDYLEPIPDERLRLDRSREVGVADVQPVAARQPGDTEPAGAPASAGAQDAPSPVGGEPTASEASDLARSSVDRTALNEIDAAMKQELSKPAAQRMLGPLIERYRHVEEQTDDEISRQYAQGRIKQLTNLMALNDAARRLRQLEAETDSARRRFLEGRTRLPRVPEMREERFDARGELRTSSLYAGGTTPKRFRLVAPDLEYAKTIGYVEIPKDSSIDGEAFLGRIVGVHAASVRLLPGGVDPVPVYILGDLVALKSPSAAAEGAARPNHGSVRDD